MASTETKIECQCGSHLRFDLEPVAGHAPQGFSCPSCGTDVTGACEAFLDFLGGRGAGFPTAGTRALKEILLPCACGLQLKLDFELADQQAPAPVTCPSCTTDLTTRANELIRTYPTAHALNGLAAAHSTSADAASQPATSRSGNRAGALSSAPHPHKPSAKSGMAERGERHPPRSTPATQRVLRGRSYAGAWGPAFTGSLGGAVLGALIWYGVVLLAGPRANWLALLPGLLAGLGAQFAGRGVSPYQGVVAAGVALAGNLVMVLVLTVAVANQTALPQIRHAYQTRLALAKTVMAAKDDQELRRFMGETTTNATIRVVYSKLGPSTISPEMLAKWKQNELPRLRALADGSYSRGQFERDHLARARAAMRWEEAFFAGFGALGMIFTAAGIIGALKLGSN